ncbi:MAG: DUF2889 domain-containing protein [Candidatus Woesearchaeota archaeon]
MEKELLTERNLNLKAYKLQDGNAYLESTFMDRHHLIQLKLEIDMAKMQITYAEAQMSNCPFAICKSAEQLASNLEGLVIGRGILKEITSKIGGSDGCVHLKELAIDTMTFAANSLYELRITGLPKRKRKKEYHKMLKGTCRAFPK